MVTPSTESVLDGTSITFRATPNGDYIFSGWSGSLSGTSNPATIVATSNLNVVANFQLRDYPLTLSVEGEGSIEERVISTKTEYSSGTVVELTATPVTGWSFDHWEGDLTGSENPSQITVSSAKSVKAVFTMNKYAYSLTIVGPGAVDEYLVENTKGIFDYGTKLVLKALPDEGAVFVGWSGDYTGNEMELELPIDSRRNIIATFETYIPTPNPANKYPLPDLSLPSSYLRRLYYGVDFRYCSDEGYSNNVFSKNGEVYSKIIVDYNRDGYLDFVIVPSDYTEFSRMPLGFWTGNPDGTFSRDEKNDGRIEGMNWPRKIIYGDFNNDGYPDICPISTGWDHEPWPGEYPVIVLSSPSGVYSDDRYTDIIGYFHGGASGDYDNDGDLDIIPIREHLPCVLINNGTGKFSADYHIVEFPKNENIMGIYTADIYDFDHDGYLDLICAGNDWDYDEYLTSPIILYGNGVSYSAERYTMLPKCPVGYGLCLDTKLKDVDGDGIEELFLFRTGDSTSLGGTTNYQGWAVQVIKWDGSVYIDVTNQYFKSNQEQYPIGSWHPWWDFEEIDGSLCLISEETTSPSPILMYKFNGSTFDRLYVPELPDPKRVYENGFCVFSDDFSLLENKPDGVELYETEAKAGDGCIQWVAGAPFLQGVNFLLGDPADLSRLATEGYSVEFWIKVRDPELRLYIHFESDCVEGEIGSYNYDYDHRDIADGSWHRIVLPLSEFYAGGESSLCNWKNMHKFCFSVASDNTIGTEFYLDEIRIRKVLPDN